MTRDPLPSSQPPLLGNPYRMAAHAHTPHDPAPAGTSRGGGVVWGGGLLTARGVVPASVLLAVPFYL